MCLCVRMCVVCVCVCVCVCVLCVHYRAHPGLFLGLRKPLEKPTNSKVDDILTRQRGLKVMKENGGGGGVRHFGGASWTVDFVDFVDFCFFMQCV